jgi:DNA-binding FrmR family transcriptional regulator
MTSKDKNELRSRLKRVGGQVAGIQRMLDEDRPLLDVITQLAAVRAALSGVANIVIAAHVEARAEEILANQDPRDRTDFAKEMVTLLERRSRDG